MKRKFFSSLAVFFDLALTSCQPANNNNGGGDKSEPETYVPESKPAESNHKHKYGDWATTKPATCLEAGEQERVCDCGDKQTKEIPATGHTFDNGVVTKAATCSVPGEKTFTCTACGATKVEEIKAEMADLDKEKVHNIRFYNTRISNKQNLYEYNVKNCTNVVFNNKKIS